MRKSTGVIRRMDELGRIVLPKEIRRTFMIQEKDPIEIFVDGDSIILKKYESEGSCMITGEVANDNISVFDGKIRVSQESAKALIKELEKNIKASV